MSRLIDGMSRASEVLVEIGRLKTLADGVVAVALTLLVFSVRLPEASRGAICRPAWSRSAQCRLDSAAGGLDAEHRAGQGLRQ